MPIRPRHLIGLMATCGARSVVWWQGGQLHDAPLQ